MSSYGAVPRLSSSFEYTARQFRALMDELFANNTDYERCVVSSGASDAGCPADFFCHL